MEGNVRASVQKDIDLIVEAGLREQDQVELNAMDADVRSALEHGIAHSSPSCLTVTVNSLPAAMFGVVPVQPRCGLVWLLGTDDILKVSTQFLRESKSWLGHISKEYDLVGNVVHESNSVSIRWLKWLGFTFLGKQGPFIEFVRTNNV